MGGNTEKADAKTILSENSTVRVGLVILVLTAFLGAFGSSIFWASNISNKLDFVISQVSAVNGSIIELKNADTVINRELAELRLKIELHKVQLDNIQSKVNTSKP